LDDKEDNEPQYKMIDLNDKVEKPKELMMFDSLEEVEEYYRKYGQQVGFGVVKRTGKKGKDGSRRYITLACIRQGKPNKGKDDCTKAVPKIIRTQCKARICATLSADGKWFSSQVDIGWILSVVPLPLSQGVLLNLLWHLACDINNNPSQKLSWMTVVAKAIIPTDPAIAVHVQPILFQVYNILNHQSTLLTQAGVELTNIHFLINVINSMIMTFK